MLTDHSGLSRFERLLTLFTRVRPGEGRSALLFMLHAFLLLFSYQVVKALREAFMLAKFSAETRSYAVAVTALVLMLLVPVYGAVRRRIDGARLLQAVTIFFAANMLVFAAAAWSGASIAFAFFVWASIYGVMVVAQLWAFAADSFNLKSGQRLFPVIMVGANIGALVGAKTAQLAVQALTPVGLMVVAALLLFATLLLATPERAAVPDGSRAIAAEHGKPVPKLLGGIGLVLRDRYLLLIATLVVLLNWINTTGEFILADFVQRDASARSLASGGTLDPGVLIAEFYGGFQFWVTVVGLAIQLFLVARIYRAVGVRGALLVLPTVAAIGYGLLALSPLLGGFVPIFTLIRFVKIAENATDYSIMNTTRQALFLPVDRDAKYEGKTAIDTFFWRIGDLIQAGVVYVGLNVLGWAAPDIRAAQPRACARVDRARGRHRPRVHPQGKRERHQRGTGSQSADRGRRLRSGPAGPARGGGGCIHRRGSRRRAAPRGAAGRWATASWLAQCSMRKRAGSPGIRRKVASRRSR